MSLIDFYKNILKFILHLMDSIISFFPYKKIEV
jgi:hypothetical protein